MFKYEYKTQMIIPPRRIIKRAFRVRRTSDKLWWMLFVFSLSINVSMIIYAAFLRGPS
jgi:hypothetical protein